MLHFAPEPCLRARLRAAEHLDYVTGDLAPGVADLTLDIADIDLPDGDFDAVICSHVLEHVPDDRAALRELRRVLRPGGWAIVQVPLVLEATIEDPGLEDPEERAARFGQEDHVRIYGPEFLDRFREAGFELTVHSMRPELTEDEITRYGLDYTHPWLRDLPAVWEIYQGHRPG